MKVIHKYPLVSRDRTDLDLLDTMVPANHKFLHLGLDGHHQTCIWCEITPDAEPDTPLSFIRVSTGWTIDLNSYEYIRTVEDLPFIWHFYRIKA